MQNIVGNGMSRVTSANNTNTTTVPSTANITSNIRHQNIKPSPLPSLPWGE